MAKAKPRPIEFVGGPLCGNVHKVRDPNPHELVFLARPRWVDGAYVHVYHTWGFGEPFIYQGTRLYDKSDRSRIMGTVP